MGASKTRKLLPGSMALIAFGLGVPASAADLEVAGAPAYKAVRPVARIYDWTGFYVGGSLGAHLGVDKVTTTTGVNFEGLGPAAGAAIDAASPATLEPTGFIGGAQAGYNLEGSGGVFGIEVDANWLGGSAARTLTNIPVINPLDVMTTSAQATFLSTLRMRWGTTLFSDRSLLFVTAGFAFEMIKTNDTMGHSGNALITTASGTTTEPGLALGGGFEYAFTDNLSAKFEYLYVAVKHVITTIPPTTAGADSITVDHEPMDHIGRFGLNYKFSGG
jgi:outer membrane immunogenic protein